MPKLFDAVISNIAKTNYKISPYRPSGLTKFDLQPKLTRSQLLKHKVPLKDGGNKLPPNICVRKKQSAYTVLRTTSKHTFNG